ncbi:ABC transporter ATP-binding protein [Bryobacterales bacterium F-183]|nr:ABC transporter ATP-binding protein [Bryobacterales bacterium F-183]
MPSSPHEVLRFDNVTVRFDEQPVVDRVSFVLAAGESRIVLGEAGAGKTVLLKTALGLIRPDSGRVHLFGTDITDLKEKALFEVRQRVGMLFQEGALFDSQTVEENVAYPLLSRAQKTLNNTELQAIEDKVLRALEFVELGHTVEKFPSELSGGMRRRVGIARATVTEPPLVLYDSPTAGLDPITANTIMALLVKERDIRNTSSMVVTHRYQDGQIMAGFRTDGHEGKLIPDPGRPGVVFMVMREGRLIFEGTQTELEASPEAYVRKFVRR